MYHENQFGGGISCLIPNSGGRDKRRAVNSHVRQVPIEFPFEGRENSVFRLRAPSVDADPNAGGGNLREILGWD